MHVPGKDSLISGRRQVMLALEHMRKTVFASMPASKLRLRQGSGVSSGAAQKRRKPRCLQVPGWREQRCWLGSSSCCCCCWCCHPPSSWCYPLTSSVSSVCWAAVVRAPLCQREKTQVKECPGPLFSIPTPQMPAFTLLSLVVPGVRKEHRELHLRRR